MSHGTYKAFESRKVRFLGTLSIKSPFSRTNIDVARYQDVFHYLISDLCRHIKVPKMISRSCHHRAVGVLSDLVGFGEFQPDDERTMEIWKST